MSRTEKRTKNQQKRLLMTGLLLALASLGLFLVAPKVANQLQTPKKVVSSRQKETTSVKDEQVKTLPRLKNKVETETTSQAVQVTTPVEASEQESHPQPTALSYQAETPTSAGHQAQVTQVAAASNGNTAGEVGSQAAAQMAAATGVSQATWEYIIARESNGNASAYNESGASGLFQTMPGWGSTATVQDQINSAINAYNAQGLSAWGM